MSNSTSNIPMLCLALPAWEGNYTKSTVELMKAVSAQAPVLYIDYAYTWKDVILALLGKNPALPLKRVLGWSKRLKSQHDTLKVWSLPPVLPLNALPAGPLFNLLHQFNERLVRQSLRRALRAWGQKKFVAINACQPLYANALGRIGAQRLYYYCYDEIGAAHWTQRHIARFESKALAMADGLICSGSHLLAQKRRPTQTAVQIPNGVDPIFLETTRSPVKSARPLIGYVGSMDERIDLELLEQVIATMPECDFSFTGRIQDERILARLSNFSNVQFHPAIAYHALPQRMQGFAVGIIPFYKNELTEGIYPMKVNEYLALGLPVVSTTFGDMPRLAGWASLADSAEDFVAALREAIVTDNDTKLEQRRAFASEQTWAARARQLLNFVQAN